MIVRPVRWPDDEAGLAGIDASYETDRLYRVVTDDAGFRLVEELIEPRFRTTYDVDVTALRRLDRVLVAECEGRVVGVASLEIAEWNRRAQVPDFFVDARARGRGVGRALMTRLIELARERGAWCLWLETQETNHPAIGFYRTMGFHLCGLDTRLYDPATKEGRQVGVFMAIDL